MQAGATPQIDINKDDLPSPAGARPSLVDERRLGSPSFIVNTLSTTTSVHTVSSATLQVDAPPYQPAHQPHSTQQSLRRPGPTQGRCCTQTPTAPCSSSAPRRRWPLFCAARSASALAPRTAETGAIPFARLLLHLRLLYLFVDGRQLVDHLHKGTREPTLWVSQRRDGHICLFFDANEDVDWLASLCSSLPNTRHNVLVDGRTRGLAVVVSNGSINNSTDSKWGIEATQSRRARSRP